MLDWFSLLNRNLKKGSESEKDKEALAALRKKLEQEEQKRKVFKEKLEKQIRKQKTLRED